MHLKKNDAVYAVWARRFGLSMSNLSGPLIGYFHLSLSRNNQEFALNSNKANRDVISVEFFIVLVLDVFYCLIICMFQ